MGYGPIKNGKHTAITTFKGSWAYEEMKKQLEATEINPGKYAVRPKGALGTHGWIKDKPWQIQYIKAGSAEQAIELAALEFKPS